jgi:hypothetical protein
MMMTLYKGRHSHYARHSLAKQSKNLEKHLSLTLPNIYKD